MNKQKIEEFFNYLAELEECRFNAKVKEYFNASEVNKADYSVMFVANPEGLALVKSKLKELKLAYSLDILDTYTADLSCYKIRDIGL